jgi:hypothetical protein
LRRGWSDVVFAAFGVALNAETFSAGDSDMPSAVFHGPSESISMVALSS